MNFSISVINKFFFLYGLLILTYCLINEIFIYIGSFYKLSYVLVNNSYFALIFIIQYQHLKYCLKQ